MASKSQARPQRNGSNLLAALIPVALEAARIVGFALLAAIVYGVARDQVTARILLEYFTVAHPKLVAQQAPTWVALAWGVAATWQRGAGLAVLLALASRAGARPARSAASLRRPIAIVFVATALGAATLGTAGWFDALGLCITVWRARDRPAQRGNAEPGV